MKKLTILTFVTFTLIAFNLKAQTWTTLNSGTSENLFGIFATSLNEVHAAGNNGIVLKSLNQGTTWGIQYSGTCNYRTIFFSNTTSGFIAGGLPTPIFLSYIYKTTNSGTTWTLQLSLNPNGLYSIRFPSATIGYAVGAGSGSSLAYKSTDGGLTWTSQSTGTTNGLFSNCFTDVNTGYAVGLNGTIIKTTNGGAIWTAQSSGTTHHLFTINFTDANTGYAVGESGTVVKTTNGGTTWTLIPIPGFTTHLNCVYFFNANHGIAVGDNGAIVETDDGGTTWTQYLGITTQTLRSMHFLNQNLGYACGDNGTILKYTSKVGVNEIDNLSVCNAYPNPANDQLTINFNGENLNSIKIEIFNEIGQSIFEFQENIPTDHYTKTIDTRAFAAGIYYISVTTAKSKWTKKITIER